MRCLFSAIILFCIQLISLQFASGKECGTTRIKRQQEKTATRAFHYQASKKHSSSFKKFLFDDAPFIHSTIKKSGFDYPLSFEIQGSFKQYQVLTVKIYNSFPHCCYSFIFDYLYPKHVFW
ncbi:hypothetical protein D3C86_733130 [compost metagenome]